MDAQRWEHFTRVADLLDEIDGHIETNSAPPRTGPTRTPRPDWSTEPAGEHPLVPTDHPR